MQLLNIDFNNPKFRMVGGMSLDDLKIKYGWFLNAEVDGAIIGEDKNGLVWYSGTWIGGIWENGTWYSGDFLGGRWKRGNWYSYDIDYIQSLEGELYINNRDISKSKFISGTWESGNFHYGIFGNVKLKNTNTIPYKIDLDFILNNIEDYDISGLTEDSDRDEIYYYEETDEENNITINYINSPVFIGGNFNDGLMNGAKFNNGNFNNGFFNNSCWYNGNFKLGIFMGDVWYNGIISGGVFSNGIWRDGRLTSNQGTEITKFGLNYKNKLSVTWEKGQFMNGEFHSIINISGVDILDNSISIWKDGVWENGIWRGGTFENGTWLSGIFENGIVLDIEWVRGHFQNGFWKNGHMIDGTVSGRIFENITSDNINLGYDI